MGEVYRARDTKLGRDVAIKVLPAEFAENEERVRRFQREAKILTMALPSRVLVVQEVPNDFVHAQ